MPIRAAHRAQKKNPRPCDPELAEPTLGSGAEGLSVRVMPIASRWPTNQPGSMRRAVRDRSSRPSQFARTRPKICRSRTSRERASAPTGRSSDLGHSSRAPSHLESGSGFLHVTFSPLQRRVRVGFSPTSLRRSQTTDLRAYAACWASCNSSEWLLIWKREKTVARSPLATACPRSPIQSARSLNKTQKFLYNPRPNA